MLAETWSHDGLKNKGWQISSQLIARTLDWWFHPWTKTFHRVHFYCSYDNKPMKTIKPHTLKKGWENFLFSTPPCASRSRNAFWFAGEKRGYFKGLWVQMFSAWLRVHVYAHIFNKYLFCTHAARHCVRQCLPHWETILCESFIFLTTFEWSMSCFLFWAIFSWMFIQWAALEDGDSSSRTEDRHLTAHQPRLWFS